MLKQIILKNFFAFNGEHKILLNPGVNLLVGINGSGKTSMINAISLLYEGVCGKGISAFIDKSGGVNAILNARGEIKPECFSLTFIFDKNYLKRRFPKSPFEDDVNYKITVFPIGLSNYSLCESLYSSNKKNKRRNYTYLEFKNGVGYISMRNSNGEIERENYDAGVLSAEELALRQVADPQRYLPSFVIKEAIASMAIYGKFNIDALRKPSDENRENRLSASGENLPYLYNRLHNNETIYYNKIREELHSINPNYVNVGYSIFGNRLFLHLEEKNLNHSIDMLHISDGTVKFMLLMGIFFNPNRGNLCAIDEPESYLHPDMIRSVAKMIKSASKDTQLIIATHSALLLNAFTLSDILVFGKDSSNNTYLDRGNKVYTCEEDSEEGPILPGQLWLNGEIGGMRW